MKRIFTYIFYLSFLAYLFGCQQKMICPAYHSYFILDIDETRKTFSLFGEDSLPKKNWEVDKQKFGIAREKSRNKKLKEMRIISMNSVYKKLEDPFEQYQREFAESETAPVLDSAAILERARSNPNEITNIDQMIYLYHYGKYLRRHKRDEEQLREDMEQDDEPLIKEEPEAPKKKKRGLFRKKRNDAKEGEGVDNSAENTPKEKTKKKEKKKKKKRKKDKPSEDSSTGQ